MIKKSTYSSIKKVPSSTKSGDSSHNFEVSSLVVKEKVGGKAYDDMTDKQYLSLMKDASELFKRPLDPSKRVD